MYDSERTTIGKPRDVAGCVGSTQDQGEPHATFHGLCVHPQVNLRFRRSSSWTGVPVTYGPGRRRRAGLFMIRLFVFTLNWHRSRTS